MKEEIYKLNNVDPEDIVDVLVKIQRSFNIKLDNDGLRDVDTFGDLCDVIINKISLEHEDSCTTQHAFYMLRNSIAAVTGIDKCAVKPQTRLSQILPKENRLQIIAEIENDLGFKTNLLQPKQWIVALFGLTLIGSFIICFYNWPIGIAGLLSSGISLKLSGKFGKEMYLKTVGDLANKISRESYLRSRRNPCTINKNEVEQKVKELFIKDLDLEPIVLTRKSQF
jgi:acyl carrier protein